MESMLLSKRFPEGLAPHFLGVNTCWYPSTAVGQVPFPEHIVHGVPEIVLCCYECRANEEMLLGFCVTTLTEVAMTPSIHGLLPIQLNVPKLKTKGSWRTTPLLRDCFYELVSENPAIMVLPGSAE